MLSSRRFVVPSVCLLTLAVSNLCFAQAIAPPSVHQQIAQRGSAHVVVGVTLRSFEAEGRLTVDQIGVQQAAIRQALDQVIATAPASLIVGHRYERIPFFSARVDLAALTALEASPGVASISQDAADQATLVESVPLVRAPATWAAGATGAGWKVAILDTGVATTHSFLTGRTYAEGCFSNQAGTGTNVSLCPGGVGTSTAPGSGANCAVTGCHHGTHVAGIAVGSGGSINGVAPNAQLIALQVFTRFDDVVDCGASVPCVRSYMSDQVAALEYVLALAGPGNVNQIAAANLSLGGGQYTSQAACDAGAGNPARRAAIESLRSIGIATVVASGNNSYVDALNAPACISSAVSVGSTTKADAIVASSNRAPFLSLLAPGSTITSSLPPNAFGILSGTSMASPHVAGAWAVLKQAKPTASVTDVLTALRGTGVLISDDASQTSYPRIDIDAARIALVGPTLPGQPTITSVVQYGGTLSVSWSSGAGGAPTAHRLDFFYPDGTPIVSATAGAGHNHSIALPAGVRGSYGVSVTASNAIGSSPSSAIFSFTIAMGAPGQPTVTAAAASGNILTTSWTSGSGAAPTAHRLDFFQETALLGSLMTGSATSATIVLPAGLQGTFAVQATAFNGALASPPSPLLNFTIGPSCTVPTAPVVSGGIVNGNGNVAWPAVAGATAYIVSAGTAQGGTQFLDPTNIGATTSVTASGLPAGFQAWIRVMAVNACGQQSAPTDLLLR